MPSPSLIRLETLVVLSLTASLPSSSGFSSPYPDIITLLLTPDILTLLQHCDKVSLVWLHQCSLFLPASIRMCVRSSTSGIRRDEISISRLSVRLLHSLEQFIVDPQQLLEGVVVDHEWNSV